MKGKSRRVRVEGLQGRKVRGARVRVRVRVRGG